jgi:hypothetical protein
MQPLRISRLALLIGVGVDDAAQLRQAAMAKLRAAVSFATASELVRAAQFLDFAREVRSGKRRLRANTRHDARTRAAQRYGYYGEQES